MSGLTVRWTPGSRDAENRVGRTPDGEIVYLLGSPEYAFAVAEALTTLYRNDSGYNQDAEELKTAAFAALEGDTT